MSAENRRILHGLVQAELDSVPLVEVEVVPSVIFDFDLGLAEFFENQLEQLAVHHLQGQAASVPMAVTPAGRFRLGWDSEVAP